MMCLGVSLFGFILFGAFCTSWTCGAFSFTRLVNFSVIIFFFSFLFFSLCLKFICIIIQVQLSPFSCHHFPPPHSLPPSTLYPAPLWLCSWIPLYMFLDDPSPYFPCDPPSSSPLVIVSLFFILMSMVIFCLFVLLIRFHHTRSYGICLSLHGSFHLA